MKAMHTIRFGLPLAFLTLAGCVVHERRPAVVYRTEPAPVVVQPGGFVSRAVSAPMLRCPALIEKSCGLRYIGSYANFRVSVPGLRLQIREDFVRARRRNPVQALLKLQGREAFVGVCRCRHVSPGSFEGIRPLPVRGSSPRHVR